MKKLLPLLLLVICGTFIPAQAQVVNEVLNPNFAPTVPNGPDGGRDWTLVSGLGFCIVQDDDWDNGYPPVTDGSLGYLVERVPGTAPDFEYATSEWTNASPGQMWEAQIYEAPVPPGGYQVALLGSQVGTVGLIFADDSLNILAEGSNVVITSSSPVNLSRNAYQLGTIMMVAPAGTAYVQMLVGFSDPGTNVGVSGSDGAIGQLEADNALLCTPPAVSFTAPPPNAETKTIPLTVAIPPGFNASNAVEVMVTNGNPSVVSVPGSVGGVLTLTFATGATNVQVIDATVVGIGTDILTIGGQNLCGNPLLLSLNSNTNFYGEVLNAAYAPGLAIDGTGAAWGNLTSDTLYMNTSGNNNGANPGNLGVAIRYAWDYTNLYILVAENTTYCTAILETEAPSESAYLSEFWNFDCIAFWMNLTTTCGKMYNGVTVVKPNADFQPWFGFSSDDLSLFYARANDSTTEDLAGLAHARIFTSGNFEDQNRKIEIGIAWADIAADVATNVQPGGNIASNLAPGLQIESEPLLVYHNYNSQSFIGVGNMFSPPSGADSNSVNVQLGPVPASPGVTETNFLGRLLNAAYAPGLAVDGTGHAWSGLNSDTLYMDTSANNTISTNGNLGVDIRYAWDYTNLYILVAEDTNLVIPLVETEAPSETAYGPSGACWEYDSVAFWINLTTTCGNTYDGVTIVKDNSDFEPWFGFSSDGLSLFWGRANDLGAWDVAGLTHARMFTSGDFAAHNRKVEVAIVWADLAADVSPTLQPGGNIASNLAPGLQFESEPFLLYNSWQSQSFIGAGNIGDPPSGSDVNSVNVQLGPTGLPVTSGFPTNTPPAFVAAGQLHLNLMGTAGSNFRLWSTTNLALHPVTNTWTLVGNGTFSVAGAASITDAQATSAAKFYVITEP